MFSGPVRVPSDVGSGTAKVRLSFPDGSGPPIAAREIEILVRDEPVFPAEAATSNPAPAR